MTDLRKAAEDALKLLEHWAIRIEGEWGMARTLEELEKEGSLEEEILNLRAALEQEKFCDAHCTWANHHPDCEIGNKRRAALDEVHQSMHEEYHGTMARNEMIRLAREAGASPLHGGEVALFGAAAIERFAALVAAAEREKVAAWMHFNDYTTGHGDTIEDLLEEIQAQAAESERWKCAEVAEAYEPTCDICPSGVANAIRARGET